MIVLQALINAEHAIQRTIHLACHIGGDKHYRLQVFVINGLLMRGLNHPHHLAETDHLALLVAEPDIQQSIKITFICNRQLQT